MNDYISLQNEVLRLKIADCPKGYNSSRFDWTAFITEIIFQGKHHFEGTELLKTTDPLANGRGICTEFRVPHHADVTSEGDIFLKPGVGLLTQKGGSKAWQFDHRYQVAPFKINKIKGKDWISYQTEGEPWRGIHLNEYKLLRLVGNSIIETMTLDNLGTEEFHCMDFNHDYFQINGKQIGPSYRMETPDFDAKTIKESILCGNLIEKNGEYTWSSLCNEVCRSSIVGGTIMPKSYVWGLYEDESGVGVREYIDIPYNEFATWAVGHVCTPKILAPITVKPGKSVTWTRRWEFVKL